MLLALAFLASYHACMNEENVRTRNIFDPADGQHPFKLSRSKLEQFLQCPRCFYLDRRLGIERPDWPSPTLNIAVDQLMKREFDLSRGKGEAHPLMQLYDVEALPLQHPDLAQWRDAQRGISFLHEPSNFLFFGAVDDVWVDTDGQLMIVDYKATSTVAGASVDLRGKDSYKRQLEMYQWLFRQNGFAVSPVGYLVFANADRGRDTFDGRLEFTLSVLPYQGDTDWVADALVEAKTALMKEELPMPHPTCEWCGYRRIARNVEQPMN